MAAAILEWEYTEARRDWKGWQPLCPIIPHPDIHFQKRVFDADNLYPSLHTQSWRPDNDPSRLLVAFSVHPHSAT